MKNKVIDFAGTVKALREQHNYSLYFVAKTLGITPTSYRNYEIGKCRPEYENLVKLANLYDVSIDFLLGNDKI